MRAAHEDLGFDEKHEAVGLADARVAGQRLGVLFDGQHGGRVACRVLDVKNGAPPG